MNWNMFLICTAPLVSEASHKVSLNSSEQFPTRQRLYAFPLGSIILNEEILLIRNVLKLNNERHSHIEKKMYILYFV